MTTVIDERVVEMKFNNAEFEKNVAQSMETLDKLKKSLNFEGAGKSLEEISKAANGFRLTGISDTISEATSKFSVMEVVGITAIAKITNSIMDMGAKLVKSLSVDQVSMGFDKYAEKTTAIQTIMAATESMFSSQAEQMRVVEEQMSKLAWFTDETSYNFNDMVSNIGKFTSNRIGLEESVTAMQGIANWAARSGQNAQAASRAMYNISQAMGAGAMKQKDWMSIENANMATAEFKQTAIDTAVELGRLKKVSDGLWETLDGKGTVTVETFREELKRGWFDKDVMSATFAKYGEFTNVLNELYNATGKATSEILEDAEEFKKGNLDIRKYAEDTGMSVEELTKAFEELNAEGNELGKKAFGNAQEAKTFMEAIDATKDAVSTKWSETFEIIFGNYLEAKKLWTGLANDLWEAFAAGGDERNELLKAWKELGGRKELIMGVVNAANLLVKPLSVIKMALKDMFPDAESMGEVLYKLTVRFRELMDRLQPSNDMLNNLYRTFRGLFTLGKLVSQVIFAIVKAIIPAARPFGTLIEMILTFTGYAGVLIEVIADYAEEVGIFQAITEGVIFVFSKLLEGIKTVATFIGGGLLIVATTVATVFGKIITAVSGFLGKTQILQRAIGAITKAVDFFKRTFSSAAKPIEKVNTVIVEAEKYFGAAAVSGAEFGTVINDTGEKTQKALTPLQRIGNVIKLVATALGLAVTTILKLIAKLWTKIKEFFNNLRERLSNVEEDKNAFVIVFEELFNKIKELIGDAKNAIKEFFDNLGINTDGIKSAFDTINTALGTFIENVGAGRIVAIVLSIALLALVGEALDLASKISTLTGTMNTFVKNINKFLTKQFQGKITPLMDLAKAFAMIAGSLALLMYVDPDGTKIVTFAATMGILVASLAGIAYAVEWFSKKHLAPEMSATAHTILALAGAIVVVSGAMAILAQIDVSGDTLKELQLKMLIAIGGLVAIAGIATVMSHLVGPLTAGAATIIALGFALMQVAKAMKEISTVPIDDINARWPEYVTMFGGISAMLAASSLLNIRSALGLILTAKGIQMLFPQISNLVELAKELPVKAVVEAALENVQMASIFLIGTTLAVIAAALIFESRKNLIDKVKGGGIFSGIGGALAGLGVSIFLIVSAIEKLQGIIKDLSPGELTEIGITIGIIIGALGAVAALIIAVNQLSMHKFPTDANTSFVKMGMMFVGLGVALRLMASAVTAIAESTANGFELAGATTILVILGGLLSLVVWVAGDVPKAIPAMAALVTATIAMGVLIGELAILSLLVSEMDWATFGKTLGTMVVMFAGMAAVMAFMSKLSGVKAGVIWGLVGIIVAIGAVLAALTIISATNPVGLAMAIGGLIGTLAILKLVFTVVDQMDPPSVRKIVSMVAVIITIGVIGASLAAVAKYDWASIAAAGGSIVAALGMMAVILIALDKIGSQGGQLGAAGALALMGFAVVEIAFALDQLKEIDVSEAAGKLAAILGIMSIFILIFGAISAIPAIGQGFALGMIAFGFALIESATAFLIFAAAITPLAEGINLLTPALKAFAEVPFFDIGGGLAVMAGGLTLIGFAGIIFGAGAVGLGLGAAALWALGLAAGASVDNLNALAAVDLTGIALGLAAIGAVGAGFGLFAPLILAGAVAIGALGASLMLLKAGFDAIDGAFQWFTGALASIGDSISQTVQGIKDTITSLFPDLAAAFTGSDAKAVGTAATTFGDMIGGHKEDGTGIAGGFAQSDLWWLCEPKLTKDFKADTADSLANNGEVVSAATQSGGEIGDAFGSSFFEKASAWFANLGASISSWWSGVTSAFSGGSAKVVNDLGSAGAAAEKFGNQTQKSGNVAAKAFDWIGDKVSGVTDKVKEKTKDLTKEFDIGAKFENYFTEMTEDMTNAMDGATTGAAGLEEGVGGAGKAAKGAAEDFKSFGDTLTDTLSGQLDMFSKFEIKTGVTADQMIENMKSNIDGFASWSHRMTVLAERFAEHGISDTLYKSLAELGPKGYETMNAFYQMTDEQLEEVRGLWETGLTLPEGQADIVAAGFQYMGEMSTQGFSDALDEHKAAHAGSQFGKGALRGIAQALGIASPSKETFAQGVYVTEGLGMGMTSETAMSFLEISIQRLTDYILELFNTNLSEETMAEAGTGILTNLFTGILGESIEGNPVMLAFIETFTNFELIDEALNLFVEHLKELLYELFEIGGDEEPSQWFWRYVLSFIQGMINSLVDNEPLILTQLVLLTTHMRETLDEQDLPGQAYDIGMNIALGLAEGINAYAQEAIDAASEMAEAVMAILESIPVVASPSKRAMKIGAYISEGYAIGIADGAQPVYNAAKQVAEGSLIGMETGMGRLQDVINEGLDFNPIITPMLDLSLIRSQISELDSLMNNPLYGIDGQNEGNSVNGKTPSQITFTQNNYSPKALSRYEIYRQTKNQLSQLKGALG